MSGIDAGTDVNCPPLSKVATGVSAGSGSQWARLSAALAGSQLDVKPGSPTIVARPTRRVLHGSRRDDDSSGSIKVQAVARRLTAFFGRLHEDTAEDDLKELMSAAGLQELHCCKLKVKDGRGSYICISSSMFDSVR